MDKLARWAGDNPRRRLEDELMDRINRHRRIRSEYRPMVQGVMRLEKEFGAEKQFHWLRACLLYTSPSPRDQRGSRMPSSA